MQATLQFLIMVDAEYDRREITQIILTGFPEAVPRKPNSCDLRGNWIEVWANEGADPERAEDEENGFLDYRWRVEATPMTEDITESEQVKLAKALRTCFVAARCKAVICANFEDKL